MKKWLKGMFYCQRAKAKSVLSDSCFKSCVILHDVINWSIRDDREDFSLVNYSPSKESG